MSCVYGWVAGRAGVRYVITKFSRMDSSPNFLAHGAPPRARSSVKKRCQLEYRKSFIKPLPREGGGAYIFQTDLRGF